MRSFTVSALGPRPPQYLPAAGEEIRMMKKHWKTYLEKVLPDQPDLIVLPECCDRFPLMPMEDRLAYYRERGTAFLDFFAQKAADNNCCIVYSAVLDQPDGTRRNCSTLLGRDGKIVTSYNKTFPVIEEKTIQNIQPGSGPVVAETEFGRVGFAICFDLNFTELTEAYAAQKPEILLFSSMYHGAHAQTHWAYTCRSYFVGAVADNECTILDPQGSKIASSTNYTPFVTRRINTDFEVVHLDYNWDKLLEARKKYGRKISISDPGKLGSVLVTSEHEEISAAQMVKEFEIERLDDYLARVRKFYGSQ